MRHRNILAGLSLLAVIGFALGIFSTVYAEGSSDPYELPIDNVVVTSGESDVQSPSPPPEGEINTTTRTITPGNSETYTETIGNAPGMDQYRWYNQDFGWTHTFDPEGKTIISAKLEISAWDVDVRAGAYWEHNLIYADGNFLGELQGSNRSWSTTTFEIDPDLLSDGSLSVWVNIDSTHSYYWWAVTIDWSRLTVEYEEELDYIKVTPTPVEVIIGQTQQFTAQGYTNGPDGIEGTADDGGPFSVTADWSIGQQKIGSVDPKSGSSTTFTAVEELPEKKDKLVGHVIASVTTTEGEKVQGKAKVTVIAYAKLSYLEAVDAKDSTRKSRETLQMASVKLLEKRTATITAYKDKPEMDWAEDEPVWWGLVEKKGVDSVTYAGTKDGKEHARAGNVPKLVTIEIVNGVEHVFSVEASAFAKLQDILVTVAKALKGKEDDVTCNISGQWKWYKVDQTRSPLCQTTHELSASGNFGLSKKFHIPSLSFNIWLVKGGAFAEPAIKLTITGVDIVRDGTKNPVAFTQVGGGAGLQGSISAGADFEATAPKKVFILSAEVKGTASASGSFEVSAPGPKLSGAYNVGKVTLSGEVRVKYHIGRRRWEKKYEVSKPVWDGKSGIGEVDLSPYFS